MAYTFLAMTEKPIVKECVMKALSSIKKKIFFSYRTIVLVYVCYVNYIVSSFTTHKKNIYRAGNCIVFIHIVFIPISIRKKSLALHTHTDYQNPFQHFLNTVMKLHMLI